VRVFLLWRQTSDQYGTEELVHLFDAQATLVQWLAHNPTSGRVRSEEREVVEETDLRRTG
jgi:hypothetical protein